MINRTFAFRAIDTLAHQVETMRRNTIILNSILSRKQQSQQRDAFTRIKHTFTTSYSKTIRGLMKLNSVMHHKVSDNLVAFFNELEMLSLVYQLVFCRMMALRWKEKPRFMSVQHLVRSYLQTLWMKNSDKYEYVQDLIEDNSHVYTVLLDDLVTWHYEHIKKSLLSVSITNIKNYSKPRYKKLENLIRILNKFNQKVSKVHLLDFIGKVNRTRPKESLFYLLHSLFSYYSMANKQTAFNKMKMGKIKEVYQSSSKVEAFNILKNMFENRRQQVYNSMAYRGLFPIENALSVQEAADILKEAIEKLLRKRTADGMTAIKRQLTTGMSDNLASERQIVSTIETRINRISQKQAELIKSFLEKIFLKKLGLPFRLILRQAARNDASRFKIFSHLDSLLMKRYLAGFNRIKAEADSNRGQELMAARESLTLLDTFFKNKINEGRPRFIKLSVRSRP